MSIIIALLIFSFIVFIHELGHFLFARRGGIAVEEFAIGMGPKLFGFHSKGTEWTIRLLPIGGFCKMYGEEGAMEDESSDDTEEIEDTEAYNRSDMMESTEIAEETEATQSGVDSEEREYPLNGDAFYEKSVGVRMATIFGGPLFNFILALVFSFIYVSLTTVSSTVISEVPDDMPAYEAGIQPGDRMISINGHHLFSTREATIYINMAQGDPVDVELERTDAAGGKERLTITVPPASIEKASNADPDKKVKIYQIGVRYEPAENGVLNVVKYGIYETISNIKIVFYSLGLLVTGRVSPEQLSGPVGIVSQISKDYTNSIAYGMRVVALNIIYYIILLSANLGVMNLLPIPALDGARLVFLAIEGIRGKPVPADKEGFVHFVGFALLMVLMVYVLFNDVSRLF